MFASQVLAQTEMGMYQNQSCYIQWDEHPFTSYLGFTRVFDSYPNGPQSAPSVFVYRSPVMCRDDTTWAAKKCTASESPEDEDHPSDRDCKHTYLHSTYIIIYIYIQLHISLVYTFDNMHTYAFSYAINYIQIHADLHIVQSWAAQNSCAGLHHARARGRQGTFLGRFCQASRNVEKGKGQVQLFSFLLLDDLSVRSWMESLLTTKCCSFRCLQCWLQYLLKSSVSSDTCS